MDNPAASRSSPPNNRPSGRSTLGSNNGPPASSTEPSNSALPPNQTLAPAPAVKKNIQSRAPSNGSVRNQSSGPTTNDPPGLSLPTTSRLLESTGRPDPQISMAKSRDQPPYLKT
ncbi:hypothetical protein Pst134EA_003336 [Puccinia striiformis f. sp. tritici]|uniref:hypothetical protein n=1 Tax=Puccinia striiformis f. sp. tritici TaxID=168172 RepID=UPI0020081540|nr:hypothetical protein Pst134EA_003336 [Puccinia striiformis f. sp. tritici]KAH9472728.1 hypothetical protein Pst134EA_003336 [Puccinia striiformis f. sp. tritici]